MAAQSLAVVLLVLVLLLALLLLRERGRASRASRRRVRRAQDGEERARALLEEQGFRILAEQHRGRWCVEVDEGLHEVEVIADLIVERDGWRYVAEVKTGDLAPDPLRPATRRQLLEYLMAFEPDGLLLVDMDRGCIHEVGFPALEE
jgi:Holliday junction resolvase-like predicted endonuclease